MDLSSSSSSSSRTRRYHVFPSFHRADIRGSFLSHILKQFRRNGIRMFVDQEFPSSQIISPEVTQAIRESKISLVILSKDYASSSWNLDALLEILKCKEEMGQIVMTVFYKVDSSDVRNQTGDFGKAFDKTCAHHTEEKRERWSQALKDVPHTLGYNCQKWDTESEMIEKISRDISNKLNTTISSRDFEDMVGLETHLEKIQSLLHLDNEDEGDQKKKDNEDEAMIVGICGPPGIGKTTIVRALHSRHFLSFQLNCFMENLRGSYNSGLDEYGLKLRLQEQLLSKILNQNGMRIYHLGAIHERLCDQKVLIILDAVNDLWQLEALANETTWFGRGSRIIVTTEDQELLRQHGINSTYHVDFPSSGEALKILCRYAFRQSDPLDGFMELAEWVVYLCNNLPLTLRKVGSSLRGKKEEEWENLIRRLAPSNKQIRKGKHRCSTGMAFVVVINLLLEIASAVVEHLSSIRKPYFARISVVMSFLSVVLSILDLFFKIRDHKASFRCRLPIPWFYYYPAPGYNIILGNFTDTILLFCAVGGFIVSMINWSFNEKRREGPIKASVWPLFFAIGLFGMVVYKFIQEKLANSKDSHPLREIKTD